MGVKFVVWVKRRLPLIILTALVVSLMVETVAQPLAWRHPTRSIITSLSASRDGGYVAAGTENGVIYLLGGWAEVELWKYAVWDRVNAVSVSEDGGYVAAGGNNRFVYLFDRNLTGHTCLWKRALGGSVLSLALSGNGEFLAAGCFDHRVYFFESGSSTPVWSYETGGRVYSVDISREGNFISAGSDDGYVYVFDREYTGHTYLSRFKTGGSITTVSLSPDGFAVAAGSRDGYMYFQDRRVTSEDFTWRHKTGFKVTSTSTNGELTAAGDESGRVYLFDKEYTGNKPLWTFPIGEGEVYTSLPHEGKIVAVGGEEGVYLFDREFTDDSYLWHLPTSSKITWVEASSDGSTVVAGDEEGDVYFFHPATTPSNSSPLTLPSSSTTPPTPGGGWRGVGSSWHLLVPAAGIAVIFLLLKSRGKRREGEAPPRRRLGHPGLDALVRGGVPENYSIVLSSPPCDQKDELVKGYLEAGLEEETPCIFLSATTDKVAPLLGHPRLHILLCNPRADEISPPTPNLEKVKNSESLSEVNITLMQLLDRLQGGKPKPTRICLDNLDDVLLQHKALTTRRWLQELIPRLKRRSVLVFATINPRMHREEDLHATLSIFDGQFDVTMEWVRGRVHRRISVSRMRGLEFSRETVTLGRPSLHRQPPR